MAAVDFTDLHPKEGGAIDFSDLHPSLLQSALQPIANIPGEANKEAQAALGSFKNLPPPTGNFLTDTGAQYENALNNAGAALQYISSPLTGAVRAIASNPAKNLAIAAGASPQAAQDFVGTPIELLGGLIGPMSSDKAAAGAIKLGRELPGALSGFGRALPEMLSGLSEGEAVAAKGAPLQSKQLGDVANYLYNNATNSGVGYTPQLTNDFSQAVENAKVNGVQGLLHPDEQRFNDALDFYHQFAGKPLSIGDVQDLDQQLGRLANSYKSNGVPTEYSNRINGLKYDLRDMAYGQDAPNYIAGGDTDAVGQMLAGNQFYNQSKKAADLEKIVSDAALTDNPQASIRRGVQSLLKNPRKMNFYTDEDRQALQTARQTGLLGGLTNIFGNSAVDMAVGGLGGAAGGGLPGAVLGTAAGKAVSYPFARAGEAIQAGRINNALGSLQSSLPEVTPAIQASSEAPAILALPAPSINLPNVPVAALSDEFRQALMRSGLNPNEFQNLPADKQAFFLNNFRGQ